MCLPDPVLHCHIGGGVRYVSKHSPMISNYVLSTDAFLLHHVFMPLSIHVKAKTKLNHNDPQTKMPWNSLLSHVILHANNRISLYNRPREVEIWDL